MENSKQKINETIAMNLVNDICSKLSNKIDIAKKLLLLSGISQAEILEIPVDWNSQAIIVFQEDGTEKELFVGIGCQGKKFHYEIG